MAETRLLTPAGFPLVEPGDDLPGLIAANLAQNEMALQDGDIVILAQKVVSKAEDRTVDLARVQPSNRARALARTCDKDPRLVELILSQSTDVLRCRPGILIVRHRLGFVLANAGIDQSNIDHGGGERALLLPLDPDRSAREIRSALATAGANVAVLIIDSAGRAWRLGTTALCIGAAGMRVLDDRRGHADLFGRTLTSTVVAVADEIAAAASVVMGQGREASPLVVARGFAFHSGDDSAQELVRPIKEDLFP
ncbi:MAG: coenzyme F420-0:L-glutamate ligase [Salinisphaera sp.]|nr:coenzyme F420-0:L-glutamate ligase [Salinisphaera sp.]